jgi:hypothetical protein
MLARRKRHQLIIGVVVAEGEKIETVGHLQVVSGMQVRYTKDSGEL